MIGTRVPGLSTHEKPETASELPAAEAPLASRTIRDQVRPFLFSHTSRHENDFSGTSRP